VTLKIKLYPNLYNFIEQEGSLELRNILIISILVGLISTCLVALVNYSASTGVIDGNNYLVFFLYSILVLCFWQFSRKANRQNIKNTQLLIHRYKMRIMKRVIQSDLLSIHEVGSAAILNALGRDSQVVSQSIPMIVSTATSVSIISFLIFYIASQSFSAFFILLGSIFLLVLGSTKSLINTQNAVKIAWDKEGKLFSLFSEFLSGLKEIKMHKHRAKDIAVDVVKESREAKELKSLALTSISNYFSFIQTMLYVMVGLMVFVVPIISGDVTNNIASIATTTLFIVGSLSGVVQAIPSLSQADASAAELFKIEDRLSSINNINNTVTDQFSKIDKIELNNIQYEYKFSENGHPFLLGPLTTTFEKNKIYFIRGSNGSGKSTFIKILLGLIKPQSGKIMFDNTIVNDSNIDGYRNLFTVIFSDFHLFNKLYGLFDAEDIEIEKWLKLLEIDGIITLSNGLFGNLNLSTGQKKRVALLVALLENRDFLILDEWASDQDPEFRKKFYVVILPFLKSIGKTIIAVTHDDAYYATADKVIYIEQGLIRS
jgi:putative ATP-binding cassette transporter